ncbi:BTAD domain-containing putative transcriptional regulator [Amycolatopsis sp. lyj-84]|uniref:AfsR/SARP family transcriptional regulator n=1 Tax=Amycolatopsis sp. lyj-84 TaxID=2789284 RepID=UPI003978939B
MNVEFRLLGEVEVVLGGRRVWAGHAQQRTVLAILLVQVNHAVSVDELVDAVWGDGLPRRPRETLYGHVSRLRRLFATVEGVSIRKQPGGYVLDADPLQVDLYRFDSLVSQARACDSDEGSLALIDEALGLWRGKLLAESDAPWLWPVRERLERQRLAVELDRNDIELRLGGHAGLLARLTAQVTEQPLDERLAGQLMLAQYRCGRQAQALKTYRQVCDRLGEELGVTPAADLQQVYQRVLTADSSLVAPSLQAPVPRQLPAVPMAFIGRDAELGHLDAAHHSNNGAPVITAVGGAGGIGKTWLALRWAHDNVDRFPDGQLYANLRGFDPTEPPIPAATILAAFLRSLGVPLRDIPVDHDTRASYYRSLVADKQILVVLDNARDRAHVEPLLPGTPSCQVLITSRNDLTSLVTTHGARTVPLDYLGDGDGHALLSGYLGAERMDAEPAAVTSLLHHCGGLPLALGILAARAARHPHFPLAVLAEELADDTTRLATLQTGDLHADLGAVIASSYRALETETADVFQRLGYMIGPDIGLPAAARLTEQPHSRTRAMLDELERLHLVQQHQPGRYRMHDLVRLFARNIADPEPDAVGRLLDFYLTGSAQAAEPSRDQHIRWLETEYDNLVAASATAAEHGWNDHAWRLADALWYFRYARGYGDDWIDTLVTALQAARQLGDRTGEAATLKQLGNASLQCGRPHDSLRYGENALERYRALGNLRGKAAVSNNLGVAHAQLGHYAEAAKSLRMSAALHRETGVLHLYASTQGCLGTVLAQLGHIDEALQCGKEALAATELLTATHDTANGASEPDFSLDSIRGCVQGSHGVILRIAGRYDEALAHLRNALIFVRRIREKTSECNGLNELGETLRCAGQPAEALTAFEQALALGRSMVFPYGAAKAHAGTAKCDGAHADEHRTASIKLFTEMGVLDNEIQRLTRGPTIRVSR